MSAYRSVLENVTPPTLLERGFINTWRQVALGPRTRGRSSDRVRRDQVGTKTLPQTGCGRKNREEAGCGRPQRVNSPASTTDGTDHGDRPRPIAIPNVRCQISRMMSWHVPRCFRLCRL